MKRPTRLSDKRDVLNMSIKDNKQSTKIFMLISAYVAAVLLTYFRGQGISGPFIFLDETVYFNLARLIHNEWSYGGHGQYNPLYPLLISPFFTMESVVTTYQFARLFNAAAFSTIIFPIYHISSRFFGKKMSICISFLTLILPFASITPLIWAEPLYYALYAWAASFLLKFIDKKNIKNAMFLGLSMGLVFLTKQAGLVLIIAIYITLFYENFLVEKNRRFVLKIFGVFASMSIFIVPWLIRNLLTKSSGVLGYQSEVHGIISNITMISELLSGVLYQLSYLTVATFFIFIPVLIICFINIKCICLKRQSFIVFVVLNVIGLLLITALHRLVGEVEIGNRIHLVFGRYLAPVIPLIIITGLYGLNTLKLDSKKITQIILSLLVLLISVIIFSPLKSVVAYSIINSPDLSYLNDLLFKGIIDYQVERDYKQYTAIIISVIGFLLSVTLMVFKNKGLNFLRVVIFLLITFNLYTSWSSTKFVQQLSTNTKGLNDVYSYIDNHKMLKSKLYFDAGFNQIRSLQYISDFWGYGAVQYLNEFTLSKKIILDFGRPDSPVTPNAYKIAAPFDGSAMFNETFNKAGFKDIDDIDSRYDSRHDKVDGLEDYIFGWEEKEFKVALPPGEYDIKYNVNLFEFQANSIDFEIALNNNSSLNVTAQKGGEYSKIIDYVNKGDFVNFVFTPKNNSFWAISEIEIVNKNFRTSSGNDLYFVSSRDLPYKQVYGNDYYKVYYFQELY